MGPGPTKAHSNHFKRMVFAKDCKNSTCREFVKKEPNLLSTVKNVTPDVWIIRAINKFYKRYGADQVDAKVSNPQAS